MATTGVNRVIQAMKYGNLLTILRRQMTPRGLSAKVCGRFKTRKYGESVRYAKTSRHSRGRAGHPG